MRALIIGYGSIGKRHADNLRDLVPDVELLVLRRSAAKADETARRVGDIEEGLRAHPDVAVIASPSADHAASLISLLQAGVPCYVEKPAVTSGADIARVREVLSDGGPVTFAGCNLRLLPSLQQLHELLQQKRIGRLVRASLQVGQWLPDWRPGRDYRLGYGADPARGGGVMFDLIHEIDAARWLFGEFDDVKAIAGKFSSLDIQTEDSACLLLKKKNAGPLTAIGLDYVARKLMRRYEIVGDEGTLTWDLGSRRLELATAEKIEAIEVSSEGFDIAHTYQRAMAKFIECVKSGRATSQPLSDGLTSVELALSARESAGL